MGIAIIVLSAKIKEADLFDSADDNVKKTGRSAFYLMVIFACFALGVSALGFITAKWHKWWLVGCVNITFRLYNVWFSIRSGHSQLQLFTWPQQLYCLQL